MKKNQPITNTPKPTTYNPYPGYFGYNGYSGYTTKQLKHQSPD